MKYSALTMKKLEVYEVATRDNKLIKFTQDGNGWNGFICLKDADGRRLIVSDPPTGFDVFNSLINDKREFQVVSATPSLIDELGIELRG